MPSPMMFSAIQGVLSEVSHLGRVRTLIHAYEQDGYRVLTQLPGEYTLLYRDSDGRRVRVYVNGLVFQDGVRVPRSNGAWTREERNERRD